VGLVLLIILALFAPLSHGAPDPAIYLTPQVDGSGSVVPDATSQELESALFPYLTFIERNTGNLQSAWPDSSQALENSGTSLETRLALMSQIFASSTGNLNTRVRDSGLTANPDPAIVDGISVTYATMCQDKPDQCANGLATVSLLRSIRADSPSARFEFDRQAVSGFQSAASQNTETWQYTYNWGLANLITGDYLSAFEAMRAIAGRPQASDYLLIKVWMGLAALRMGEPDDAVSLFTEVLNAQIKPGATAGSQAAFTEAKGLAQEALGDAQWARGDPATAYKTYFDTIMSGGATYGLYRKWLQLGLEQKAYDQMLADIKTASEGGVAIDLKGRMLHDRARILSLLGRGSEALSEYRAALDLGQNDAPLLTSYAQELLANGDASGAIAQSENALRKLNRDLSAGDMVTVASTALTSTVSLFDRESAQETLDAHLVRAMGWVEQGNANLVDTLVANMTAGADTQSPNLGGLLYLYGGYVYEAAARAATGDQAGALNGKAAESYSKAWAKLGALELGQPGRAAALAGQARTTALSTGKGPSDGIAVLTAAGYDPTAIKPAVATDHDAADILSQGALLLQNAGQGKEAANALRVSNIVRNLLDAEDYSGVGRALWVNNGTPSSASLALRTGDAVRQVEGSDLSLAVYRYKQSYQLDPALAPAWNNLGVLYAKMGNPASTAYLKLSNAASPSYVLGNHNLAVAAYESGIGNFFTAENAQAAAIKASGPESLRWGSSLSYDDRGPLPSPTGPPADFWLRIGALVILLLLLVHTLVGKDRMTNRMGLVPTRGLIGRLAATVDARVKAVVPGIVQPQSGMRGLLLAVGIPAIVGMIALAWSAGGGSFGVALVFLPVALVLALLAFGVNELAQRWAARRAGAATMHHPWPTGVLIGILSIPFGFMYGWQNVTRLTTDEGARSGDGNTRKARTSEEIDLLYEAHAEAAADAGGQTATLASPAGGVSANRSGPFKLSPSANIMFAGMVANIVLGVIFALVYWYTGWPSMRLGLFATTLVLVFTSVSEPPADGWTLYRRNAPLWLTVFLVAAATVTLLAVGLI
jgi:tetratricopeptide (TPR) repeat protein